MSSRTGAPGSVERAPGAGDSASEHQPWPLLSGDEVLRVLRSGPSGLSESEAATRLGSHGLNVLVKPPKRRLLPQLAAHFTHLMALILWTGAVLALLIGLPELSVAIVAVVLINGAFSFWQEHRAERAMEELTRLLPQNATVIRDGSQRVGPSVELVPGDVIVLSEGDAVPADARLLEAHSLATNDASLTGESAPVPRHSEPLSGEPGQPTEAHNCIFAGTTVASGRAIAVVIATGDQTTFGGIATLSLHAQERPSPLQRELDTAVRAISLVAVGLGLVFTLLAFVLVRLDAGTALTFALGLIVAFVPEGLLPTLTLSLALAVQRMARRRVLVKHLPAVEALGSATVIATDKTGVLTQNRMIVVALYVCGQVIRVTGAGYEPAGQFRVDERELTGDEVAGLKPLLCASALCNYARVKAPSPGNSEWEITGDPTEGALQTLAAKGGCRVEALLARRRLAAEWPFDARRQRMTVAYPGPDGTVGLTKGSPDAVLQRCSRVRTAEGIRPLDPATLLQIETARTAFTRDGLRVLALAERDLRLEELDAPAEAVESELTFLGLAAMQDPPRPEVPEAVARCRAAGIRVIIISGDQGSTVAAVGRQVGIVAEAEPRTIEGSELAGLDGSALKSILASGGSVVFARTPPEGKMRVVRALQDLGEIVAVTGDGVNDAPALRQADVGVAMGVSGTDVARAAADIVLADDNFASIVAAVEEGRVVFDNMRKFTTYCFASNVAEAAPFVVFLLSAGRIPLALPIMLVLAVDLGTDMLPALALGVEAAEPGVMQRPPRVRGDHLVSRGLLLRSLAWLGLLEAIAAMSSFFWVYGMDGDSGNLSRARAATFAGIVLAQVANVLVCRSERGFAFARRWSPLLPAAMAVEIGLLLLVVYLPALQAVFSTAAMTAGDWVVPLAAFPAVFVVEELRKFILRRRGSGAADKGGFSASPISAPR